MRLLTFMVVLIASPVQAETLEAWIARTIEGPAVTAVIAELDAQKAGLGRAVLAYRPAVNVGWETRVTADHKLPDPTGQGEKAWIASVEMLVWDFGATLQKMEAEDFKKGAQDAFARRRVAEIVSEAGELYVRAWRAQSAQTAAGLALLEIRDTMAFVSGRTKDNAASQSALRDLEADAAALSLTREQLKAEQVISQAQMTKFGQAPAKFEAPKPMKLDPESWQSAPEIAEALLDAQAAESEALAAISARMPRITGFGTYDDMFDAAPDYRAGLRVRIDLLDSTGTDKDRERANAEADAARAKAVAAQVTSEARYRTANLQTNAMRGLLSTMEKLEALESQRLQDAKARHVEGKGQATDVVQAARRLFAIRKQAIDTRAEIVSATLRARAMMGEFY